MIYRETSDIFQVLVFRRRIRALVLHDSHTTDLDWKQANELIIAYCLFVRKHLFSPESRTMESITKILISIRLTYAFCCDWQNKHLSTVVRWVFGNYAFSGKIRKKNTQKFKHKEEGKKKNMTFRTYKHEHTRSHSPIHTDRILLLSSNVAKSNSLCSQFWWKKCLIYLLVCVRPLIAARHRRFSLPIYFRQIAVLHRRWPLFFRMIFFSRRKFHTLRKMFFKCLCLSAIKRRGSEKNIQEWLGKSDLKTRLPRLLNSVICVVVFFVLSDIWHECTKRNWKWFSNEVGREWFLRRLEFQWRGIHSFGLVSNDCR